MSFARTNYIRGQPTGSFMFEQPTSFARIYAQTTCLTSYARTPSSRDLDLHHKQELHCCSLHHTKMQVRSIKSNSSFQKKYTTSQLTRGNIFFLNCTQLHARLHPTKPRDHTRSHTGAAPRSALPINGTSYPI